MIFYFNSNKNILKYIIKLHKWQITNTTLMMDGRTHKMKITNKMTPKLKFKIITTRLKVGNYHLNYLKHVAVCNTNY